MAFGVNPYGSGICSIWLAVTSGRGLMSTSELQFTFEAHGMNITTKKAFSMRSGDVTTVMLKRGEINKISISVTVMHSDFLGPDPSPDLVRALSSIRSVQKGWPFHTRYDFDWDIDVSDDEILILGDPRETTAVLKAMEGVKTEFKTKGESKYLAIFGKSTFSARGLKLDLPFVEGEGEIVSIGGDRVESAPVKFVCKLDAPKAEKKTWPKIPDSMLVAKAYFDAKNEDKLPTQSIRDVESWVKEIKSFADGALFAAIRDKDVTIHLEGYTSKSGSKEYNKKLAESRIDSVARILMKSTNFGSGADLVRVPKNQSRFEEKHDYRVEMYFDKVRAEIAMKARET
jgi:hypothetical protein